MIPSLNVYVIRIDYNLFVDEWEEKETIEFLGIHAIRLL